MAAKSHLLSVDFSCKKWGVHRCYMSTLRLAQYEIKEKGVKKIAVKQLPIIAESLASTI